MQDPVVPAPYPDRFVARRALFRLLSPVFRIHDTSGALRFKVRQKAFRLKEDITVFGDEEERRPLISIKARQVVDFSATYDVIDLGDGQKVGALRRRGFKSMFRDEWIIFSADDVEVGMVREDTGALALVRRFLSNLIPQTFNFTVNGAPAGTVRQRFNPFLLTYDVDFSSRGLDLRLGVAAVVLLLAIEGRQS